MISISIDQQTFSDIQADLAWHRAEVVRLREEHKGLDAKRKALRAVLHEVVGQDDDRLLADFRLVMQEYERTRNIRGETWRDHVAPWLAQEEEPRR